MAHTKSCSGTVSFAGWTLVGAGCTYDSVATIDGVNITSSVSFNNTMTADDIASLYNSNRINNTTGTFTVSIVGTALQITLSGVVLPTGAIGNFSVGLTTGSPFPCASFLAQFTSLVCSIIPTPTTRRRRIGALPIFKEYIYVAFPIGMTPIERVNFMGIDYINPEFITTSTIFKFERQTNEKVLTLGDSPVDYFNSQYNIHKYINGLSANRGPQSTPSNQRPGSLLIFPK